MTKDATLHAPARLGSGPVTVYGTLDLNGQPLTLTSLSGYGTVEDTGSDFQGPLDVGAVTVLTLDIPSSFTASSPDDFAGRISDFSYPYGNSIRLVKTGAGTLTLDVGGSYTGGTELDGGEIALGTTSATLGGSESSLVVNAGTLDLNGDSLSVGTLDGSGADAVITDGSSVSGTTMLTVGYAYYLGAAIGTASTDPCLFAGKIEDGPHKTLALAYQGFGVVTLTGDNTYTGGTYIDSGWLQVGDGASDSESAQIAGPVFVNTQDGLTFDVAPGEDETFAGAILASQSPLNPSPPPLDEAGLIEYGTGSVLKTGLGSLLLTGDTIEYGGIPCAGNTYPGAMRVEEGTLTLGDSTALAPNTPLIIDNGADVDLAGNSAGPLGSVTVNDGSIISSPDPMTHNLRYATITATDAFNLANGYLVVSGSPTDVAVGATVTLDGPAGGTTTIVKRTDGTVDFLGSVGSNIQGTYDDDNPTDPNPTDLVGVNVTLPNTLYWNPSAPGAIWNADSMNKDWSTTPGGTVMTSWVNGDIAVFAPDLDKSYSSGPGQANVVTVSGAVQVNTIHIENSTSLGSAFDIEDDGDANSYISIPDSESLVVDIDSGVTTAWLGCTIVGEGNGTGSLTKEGGGTIVLGAPTRRILRRAARITRIMAARLSTRERCRLAQPGRWADTSLQLVISTVAFWIPPI